MIRLTTVLACGAILGLATLSGAERTISFASTPTVQPTVTPTPTPTVAVCHKGKKTLEVNFHAVPAHVAHGDEVGPCGSVSAVPICHKGKKSLDVSSAAVPAHLAHGDTIGDCP